MTEDHDHTTVQKKCL